MEGVFNQGYGIVPKGLYKDKRLSKNSKHVMAYLMTYTGAGNNVVWPSQATIAEDTMLSERSVRDALNQLSFCGYIEKRKHCDDPFNHSLEYVVLILAENSTNNRGAPANDADTVPATSAGSLNKNKNNNINVCYPGDFEEIWELWPKRVEKKGAYKKYKSTLAKGVSSKTIKDCVVNYIETVTDVKYCKMLKTYLGPDEPWRDYIERPEESSKNYDDFFEGRR